MIIFYSKIEVDVAKLSKHSCSGIKLCKPTSLKSEDGWLKIVKILILFLEEVCRNEGVDLTEIHAHKS